MKRIGNLYDKICSMDNLRLAHKRARKGKSGQYGVKEFEKNTEANLRILHEMLVNKTYRTPAYKVRTIRDTKERIIYILDYKHRVVHHAVMNVMESIFVSVFTADTYSCIKGRGIHAASYALRKALRDEAGTKYCLKIDIKQFYPSIDHDILKQLLRKKIKDKDLLWLLDDIIDSAPGVPIGNYLSQYFANFYLAYLDHYIKEVLKVKNLFRYADDYVITGPTKEYLHHILFEIRQYLAFKLNLTINSNYQIFPVASRGIDFVGYPTFHTHTLLRKRIKKDFARAVASGAGHQTIASYMGWAMHCDSNNLIKTLYA